ncbi:MAG: tetratricopeptide repeat protein [Microcystis wesenbergii Mw_QC_S_20081001_S30D]|uniref:Tetratricopeptide repeat protein n=1 Tax=Microcystis wesenbergii Mw_QC_S_20081001_S30D TaxID=2486245 RepID=A0A552JD74_9CHRO|nr:tetratricopeptide repeat protein [Microcystis aeruginosa W11-03]NCR92684.1 tetratricopeptide repeat protein [Microcystis aeruginosa W11-06]TRU93641.1 MAG: tetratricopeptide repeat protein [Microcystis wesenbergii Mw_QC_S_20081001_S30D]TRV05598.1 MAG: tetratricopeptide repeat protein [Microcystis wesenbergii Mw_QC_B_20070930_S4D]TRV05688.1 MAG: tetratricopeptide repeat protein [Microcystis wesenbergii Mw_QC_S_20081001_S30]TRV16453.1 MAG: tetratricopeptide repeat protein [Microcystis wesenber
MPKLQLIVSLLIFFVAGSPPAFSQALLPYAIEPELEQMEQAGIEMAEDAIQLARFRRTDAALARAKLAVQLAPHLYQTWFILGSLYLQDDQVQLGIEALNQSLSLAPADAHANIKFSLGSAYFQNQDYKSAIAQIEAGLQMKPDISPALFDLGNSYLKLAQYPAAIAAYEKAVSQDKDFWPAINNIGLVKYEQGDKEAALKDWRAALKIDPKQAEPQLAIAVAIYSQGKTEEGIKLAQAALTSDSRYVSLKFLGENLWGQRLLQDTEKMFNHPKMKDFIARLPKPIPEAEEEN